MNTAPSRWNVLTDPLQVCILVVAAMPGLAAIALASVVWTPLCYVMALYCLYSFRGVLDSTRRMFDTLAAASSRKPAMKIGAAVVIASLLMSIPVTQVFLRGDLDAMAAPAIATEQSGVSNPAGDLPRAIYGQSSDAPSYRPCQIAQRYVGTEATHLCYSQIGYLRLWQMPVALTTLVSITLLYAVFPLAIVWHVSSRPRRTTSSRIRCPKEST